MGKNKDGIIILVVLFILVGLGWDTIREKADEGGNDGGLFGDSSVGNDYLSPQEQNEKKDVTEQIRDIQSGVDELEKAVGKKIEEVNRSPYYGKIYMSYPAYLNDSDPSREYFTLTANLQKGEFADITGWYLISPITGNNATIDKATTMPFPYVRGNENIVLKQGDRAYVVKGFSPINTSFRTNKCTGYFAQNRAFYPYLSLQCPLARDEELPTFDTNWDRDQACRDYIDRILRCTVPTNLNRLPDNVKDNISSGCKVYLETKINYDVCVTNYKYDKDFAGNEWYVYLERFGPLWRSKRDTIQLRDREGLVVAEVKITY